MAGQKYRQRILWLLGAGIASGLLLPAVTVNAMFATMSVNLLTVYSEFFKYIGDTPGRVVLLLLSWPVGCLLAFANAYQIDDLHPDEKAWPITIGVVLTLVLPVVGLIGVAESEGFVSLGYGILIASALFIAAGIQPWIATSQVQQRSTSPALWDLNRGKGTQIPRAHIDIVGPDWMAAGRSKSAPSTLSFAGFNLDGATPLQPGNPSTTPTSDSPQHDAAETTKYW